MENAPGYCGQCGLAIPNISNRFCPSCGAEITSSGQSPQSRDSTKGLKTWWDSLTSRQKEFWSAALVLGILAVGVLVKAAEAAMVWNDG